MVLTGNISLLQSEATGSNPVLSTYDPGIDLIGKIALAQVLVGSSPAIRVRFFFLPLLCQK